MDGPAPAPRDERALTPLLALAGLVLLPFLLLALFGHLPVPASDPLPLLLAGHPSASPTVRLLDLGDAPRILVGRSGHADLVIDDPAVSPLHAVIYREEDRWAIADAGSETGLRANGRRWLRKILEPGTRLEFGGTTLVPVEPERLFTEDDHHAEAPETGFDPFDFGSAFVDDTLQNRPDEDG